MAQQAKQGCPLSGSDEACPVVRALMDLKTVAGLLFDSSLLLPKSDAERIGYLAQRVETHADAGLRALERQAVPAKVGR